MKKMIKLTSIRFALAVAGGLAMSVVSTHAQSAMATISGTQAGSDWDYTITLENTSAPGTSLEGFWYGWIVGDFDLGAVPSNASNSLGWANTVDGDSIQFQGGAGDALGAGQSGTFSFESTENPTEITTSPQGESVAFTGTIGFNENEAGVSTPVFSPELVTTPEPSTFALLGAGGFVLILMKNRKLGKPGLER
jgi:hypothetical protein